jgi:hypothetical protein
MVNSVSLDFKHRKSVAISLTNDKTARFDIPTIRSESSLNLLRELIRRQVSARKEQLAAGTSQESSNKEIIKEKEVIVKIRCPYCHNLYDESSGKCPHCGGHS